MVNDVNPHSDLIRVMRRISHVYCQPRSVIIIIMDISMAHDP